MSARPNPDYAITKWLRDEADAGAPDRLIWAIRSQLESTDQRRAWWPARRFQPMNTTVRLLSAVAAVAVVAVVGVLALQRINGNGVQPSPSQAFTPSSVPPISASAVPLMLGASPGADLPAGTYLIDDPFPIRATFTVPAGWTSYTVDTRTAGILVNHARPVNGSGWGLFFLAGPHFYADPCRPANGTVDASAVATAAKVAATLSSLPSVEVGASVAATVGGRPATLLTLTAGADTAACSNAGATFWQTSDGTDYVASPGEATPFRVVDVDGQPIVILATDFPRSSHWEDHAPGATPNPSAHAADQVELSQILASIQIEGRTAAGPAPSPSP